MRLLLMNLKNLSIKIKFCNKNDLSLLQIQNMKRINPYVFPGIRKEDLLMSKFPYIGVLHPKVTIEDVFQIVQEESGVTIEDILSKNRKRTVAEARHIIAKCLRDKCKLGVSKIGELLNKRDHTTAIHSISVYNDLYQTNEVFKDTADRVNAKIGMVGCKNS